MTTQQRTTDFDQLLTVKRVAERFAVSTATVWRLAKSGAIPQPIRIGNSVRWRSSDLESYLAARD